MRFNSLILGRSIAWTFSSESDLQRWASECPWFNRGGVLVVSVRDVVDIKLIASAVEEEIFRFSAGRAINCVRRSLIDENLTLKEFVGAEIGWQTDKGAFHFRERFRIHHGDAGPTIYFLDTRNPDDINEAEGWFDLFSKSERPSQVCFVIICSEMVAAGVERVISLTSGWLAERLLSTAEDGDERQLWLGYLAQRFVWEAGGSPGIVDFLERGFIDAGQNDHQEVVLERHLAAASRKLRESREEGIASLIASFPKLSDGRRGEKNSAVARDLEMQGMLWRPRQVPGWIFPGWVARVIASEPGLEAPWLLRRSLNCAPLAGEVVTLCTGLELKIRQQHLYNFESTNLPQAAEVRLDRWCAGDDREFVRYASIVTLKRWAAGNAWNDGWAFADLGELENALRNSNTRALSSPVLSALSKLRRIRNAISHGHPVCWDHIRELKNAADVL